MNILQQTLYSLYSPKKIALFRLLSIGRVLKMGFFLVFLSLIPFFIFFSQTVLSGYDEFQSFLSKHPHSFVIKDGELISSGPKTVALSKKKMIYFIDDKHSIEDLTLSSREAIGLSKDGFVIKSNNQTQVYSYYLLGNKPLTGDQVADKLQEFKTFTYFLLPLYFVLVYLFSAMMKFIGISLFGFVAMAIAKLFKRTLLYKQLWTISLYSTTFSTVFFSLLSLIGIYTEQVSLLHIGISLLFIMMSIKSVPLKKTKAPNKQLPA
ncbi:DUF1189 domain-containing protein [Priestia koreensis]|uniref:DUF1189 domain-containing protein n=1 Tax=Priestia koreensis TaxID=284581 RepID=UPI0006A9EF12|nr:DUF1189 domain-containing protein [Priestia koreensis]